MKFSQLRLVAFVLCSFTVASCSSSTTPTDNKPVITDTIPTGIIDLVTSSLSFDITTLDLTTNKVTRTLQGQAPDRTPDGTVIYVDDNNNLVESAPDGSAKKVIVKWVTDVPIDDHHDDSFNNPRLSKDGKYVAYEGFGGAVYVVNRTSGALVASFESVLPSTKYYYCPSWTSDGKLIVAGGNSNPGLYILDITTKTSTPLGTGLTKPAMPNVSSDGTQICFVMNNTVYTMNIDGSSVKKLSDAVTNAYYPKWSPNSKWIAVLANNTFLLVPISSTTSIIYVNKYITGVAFDNTSTQISWR